MNKKGKNTGREELMKELANVKEYFIELYKEHENLTKASRHNYHKYSAVRRRPTNVSVLSKLHALKRKLVSPDLHRPARNIDHLKSRRSTRVDGVLTNWEISPITSRRCFIFAAAGPRRKRRKK